MAQQLGRTFLIKIGAGDPVTYTPLCGLTSKTMTINTAEIDVTTADCTDPGGPIWTEVLAGVKRVSVSGNGYFKDEANEETLRALAMAASPIGLFQIIWPAFGTFAGSFLLSSLEAGGEQESGVTYSLSLGSTGAVTFTPEA